MIKDTDDHPKRKDAEHEAWEKGLRGFMSSPDSPHSVLPCVQQCRSTPNPILWGFLWRLHHTGIINHKLHFQPFSLLKKMVGMAENSKFLIMVKSYW